MSTLEPPRALAAAFLAVVTLLAGINGWRQPATAMAEERAVDATPAKVRDPRMLGVKSGSRAVAAKPAAPSVSPAQFFEDVPSAEIFEETPPLEIPDFEPPSASDQTPPPQALPLLARIRHANGSPFDSEAWKAVPGRSPLDRDAPSDGSFAELVAQLQTAATNLEKAAAQCERDEEYVRADHLRELARRIWTDARAVQGWTNQCRVR